MDKDKAACKCIEYTTSIAKKMDYEGVANSEDIISLGNEVLATCLGNFDPDKSPEFVPYFKRMFLYAIKNFKRDERKSPEFSLDSGEFGGQEWRDKRNITASKKERSYLLSKIVKNLSIFEKKVIIMKTVDGLSQKDIAFLAGKTEARISQVIPLVLDKLRSMPESKDLQEILGEDL